MRVVLQRVKYASCTVDQQITGSIDCGYLLLVGFSQNDTMDVVSRMAQKIVKLRVFEDDQGKMNRSIYDVNGSVLSISQFTLYANAKKGNRPSFVSAAKPDVAIPLYDAFNEEIRHLGIDCQTGIFGADMKINLLNDGPITICLDSEELF